MSARHTAGLAPVDHDQRNTLNWGINSSLPCTATPRECVLRFGIHQRTVWDAIRTYPGPYLPSTTTVDLALARVSRRQVRRFRDRGQRGQSQVQLDNSLTFGGFHWNERGKFTGVSLPL